MVDIQMQQLLVFMQLVTMGQVLRLQPALFVRYLTTFNRGKYYV